jgi:hypothetical protein
MILVLKKNLLTKKITWEKGVLPLALQFNFWVVEHTCNSLYLHTMSVNRQVAWVEELQLIIYTM